MNRRRFLSFLGLGTVVPATPAFVQPQHSVWLDLIDVNIAAAHKPKFLEKHVIWYDRDGMRCVIARAATPQEYATYKARL